MTGRGVANVGRKKPNAFRLSDDGSGTPGTDVWTANTSGVNASSRAGRGDQQPGKRRVTNAARSLDRLPQIVIAVPPNFVNANPLKFSAVAIPQILKHGNRRSLADIHAFGAVSASARLGALDYKETDGDKRTASRARLR